MALSPLPSLSILHYFPFSLELCGKGLLWIFSPGTKNQFERPCYKKCDSSWTLLSQLDTAAYWMEVEIVRWKYVWTYWAWFTFYIFKYFLRQFHCSWFCPYFLELIRAVLLNDRFSCWAVRGSEITDINSPRHWKETSLKMYFPTKILQHNKTVVHI